MNTGVERLRKLRLRTTRA